MTAFKKPLCGILAFILVFVFVAAAPLSVFAADEDTTAISPEEIELNKKTEDDFEYITLQDGSAAYLVKYVGNDTKVTVPSKANGITVTTIAASCFEGNTTVESVKLNTSIVTLGEAAFKNCTALKSVTGTGSLTEIGASAFEGCTALESIAFPESVTSVPEKCFAGCTALAEIKEHKNLKNCAADAFTGTPWENAQPDGPLSFGRVLYSHKGDVSELVIPEGVSIIEEYAFLGCDFIKSVEFGSDVEEIGLYAFQNCVNLETVKVDDALGIINAGAFKGCSALKEFDASEATVATIGYEAFADCSSLTKAVFSETLSEIGSLAFANTSLTTIDFGKNVKTVDATSFEGVKTLESITVVDNNKNFSSVDGVLYNKKGKELVVFPSAKTGEFALPQKVERIKNSAFKGSVVSTVTLAEDTALNAIEANAFENSAITSFVIPEAVQKIESAVFKNATKLSKVTFNEGLTYIATSAFEGCSSLAEVTLPNSLKDIASYAFKNTGIKSLNTGDGVAKIDTEAFADNKNLTDLYIGKNVDKIGNNAFANCTSLVVVTLPASLRFFDASAFSGCKSLVKLTVDKENKYYNSIGAAIYSADGKTLVVAGNKNTKTVIIADGTEVIANNAFDFATGVVAISAPATLKTVQGNALDVTAWYKNNTGSLYVGKVLYKVKGSMPALVVNDGAVAIADNAVANASVKSVVLPASLTYIGSGAFAGSSVGSVVIPSKVTYIGSDAFKGVKTLKTLKLSKSLQTLGNGAFSGCSALSAVVIPEGVKLIAGDTFANCKSLSSVVMAGVEKIAKYAFSGCSSLKTISLPETFAEVDAMSFLGTSIESFEVDSANAFFKATEDGVLLSANEEGEFNTIALYPIAKAGAYEVPEEIKNIADKAFYDCDGLTAITFKDGFENIGSEAFYDCDGLTTIDMPDSARKIGDYAFASCDELREFIVNTNLTDYADNAFDGCFYFNYDAVTINVEESSAAMLGGIALVLVLIVVVALLIYKRKQSKLEKENNKVAETVKSAK